MVKSSDPRTPDSLALIYKAAHGNQDAFRSLAEKYEPLIHKLVGSFTVPEAERDDLFQEGLIGLYKAVLMYDPELSSFGTFAYLCIKRSILSAVRSYQTTAVGLTSLPEDEFSGLALGTADSPETAFLHKESYALLLERIDSHLSDYENTVLRLYLTGVSHDLIAQRLATSRKSVDNAISRIRRKLRVLIGPNPSEGL